LIFLIEMAVLLVVVMAALSSRAVRQIPVQYASRLRLQSPAPQRQYILMKVNAARCYADFAQSLMFVPAIAVSGLNKNSEAATLIGVSGSSPTTGSV
jgi:preprotein translocase subunit SecY